MPDPQFKIDLIPEDITIAGLSIQRDKGRDILTSKTPTRYGAAGLYVAPKLAMSCVADGFLFYSQICTHHLLRVQNAGREKQFATEGKTYGDCPSPGNSFLRKYVVTNNEVLDFIGRQPTHPWVTDMPWTSLSDNIDFMQYDLNMETWLQYGPFDGPNWPIFKFRWHLRADIAKTSKGWYLSWMSYSSPAEIISSVHIFDPRSSPLDVRSYKDLKQAVRDFWADVDNSW